MNRTRTMAIASFTLTALLIQGTAAATGPPPLDQTPGATQTHEHPDPGEGDARSASSCHATIGPFGASQCFTALTPGLFPSVRIISLQLDYAASANICNKHYQFRYRLAGQSSNTLATRSDSGCSVGYASNKLTLNRDMHNGSQVCARQRNSATNQAWTSWYCHTVWG